MAGSDSATAIGDDLIHEANLAALSVFQGGPRLMVYLHLLAGGQTFCILSLGATDLKPQEDTLGDACSRTVTTYGGTLFLDHASVGKRR